MGDMVGVLVGLGIVALMIWGTIGAMFSRRYSRAEVLRGQEAAAPTVGPESTIDN